jgi:hypothetical protein
MKASVLAVVMSFLILSGWALAAQKTEQKQESPMMEHMMKQGEGEKSQGSMMRMMKMMDQCATMMESSDRAEKSKESQTK